MEKVATVSAWWLVAIHAPCGDPRVRLGDRTLLGRELHPVLELLLEKRGEA
jgi:hypothetical protein